MRGKDPDYNPFERDMASRPVVEVCRRIRDRHPRTFIVEQARPCGKYGPCMGWLLRLRLLKC